MSKRINSSDCERAGVLLSSFSLSSLSSVMMCRYAVVTRELLSTIILESCLLFSEGSEEGLGGRQRWGLWSIYEQGIQWIHVTTLRGWLLFSFFKCIFKSFSTHTGPQCPFLQTLQLQGQSSAVEKQQMLLCRLGDKRKTFRCTCPWPYSVWVWKLEIIQGLIVLSKLIYKTLMLVRAKHRMKRTSFLL